MTGRPVLDRALEWARDVADHCSPRSLSMIKQQVYGDSTRTFGDAMDRSLAAMRVSFGWPDLKEALAARQENRLPGYRGLEPER